MLERSILYFLGRYCSNIFGKWTAHSKTETLNLHRLEALCCHSIVKSEAREINMGNKAIYITTGKML